MSHFPKHITQVNKHTFTCLGNKEQTALPPQKKRYMGKHVSSYLTVISEITNANIFIWVKLKLYQNIFISVVYADNISKKAKGEKKNPI